MGGPQGQSRPRRGAATGKTPMKRGEIWWAILELPVGRRPVVLLSRDVAYAIRTNVTVAEVTRTIRALRSEVALGKRDGLPQTCVVNTDNVATIPKARLESKIASLSALKRAELDEALRFSLGLDTSMT